MKKLVHSTIAILVVLLSLGIALAQTNSGEVTGRVVDPADAVVVNAQVTLTNRATADQRQMTTDQNGNFVFPAVQPGTYSVSVVAPGFKTFEKKDLQLSSSERLFAGVLKLAVGATSDSVSVVADVTPIQAESSERSALLGAKEISSLMSIGRDPLALTRTMPGVVYDGDGASALGQANIGSISGMRSVNNTMSVDGVTGNTRGGANMDSNLNMDAVAEVKVLLNNYQAEYGQSSGAIVNMVTKSGTQQFHGSGYYYGRNEALNANSWFNNHQGIARGMYRYNTAGFTLGGPAYIPKVFNKTKDKLFFFFSFEDWPTKSTPNSTTKYRMPTALELQGDFSQSYAKDGVTPVVVKDPRTNKPFPGNIIPQDRINPNMQKILSLFMAPASNCTSAACLPMNGSATYNYQVLPVTNAPTHQDLLRLDYNLNSKWRMYFRGYLTTQNRNGLTATTNGLGALGIPAYYNTPGKNGTYNLTYIASPTLVNEFQVGYAEWKEVTGLQNAADMAKIVKSSLGINIRQNNSSQNPLDILPRISGLGSGSTKVSDGTYAIGNAPGISFDDRFPMSNKTGNWEFSDSLTKILNRHTLKSGIYYQAGRYLQQRRVGNFNGQFDFQPSTSNANGDAGFAYANMLLGNFYSYTESSNRINWDPRWHVLEWYAQDSWKAKPNLSVEFGMRFTYDLPPVLPKGQGAMFRPGLYDPNAVPAMYARIKYSDPRLTAAQKASCMGKAPKAPSTCAINVPLGVAYSSTGAIPASAVVLPDYYFGKFVSAFNYTGTTVNTDPGYGQSLWDSNGVLFAPRLGISWDPFKDGKTAIRFGLGIYYNTREIATQFGDFSNFPPLTVSRSMNYGDVATFDPSNMPVGPNSPRIMLPNRKIESNVPVQLSVQRNLGFSTVLDVAYVGSFTRHQSMARDPNAAPYGAQFLQSHLDTTQNAKTYFNGATHAAVTQTPYLPDNFFRPYLGYGSIDFRDYGGTSNYNAMQVTLNRRFAKGLQFGVSYTWSKTMTYADTYNSDAPNYQDMRWWNYGEASIDRTHNLVPHWVYTLPKASRLWDNRILKAIGDNWEWSGMAQFISGAPQQVTMNTGGLNLTGGGDGARVLLYGDPKVQFSRSSLQYLDKNMFGLPEVGTPTSDMPYVTRLNTYRGPGVNNWDMALQKNISIKEKVTFTIRAEAFNVFNHVSFTSVDNTIYFDTNNAASCAALKTPDSKCGTGLRTG